MSRIEWTEQTWNPTTGCTKVSPGCLNCYAEVMARRAWTEDVVVDRGVRGLGVGEALVHSAVNLAKQRGAKTIDLTSRQSRRAAHRLYEKAGFHVRDTSVYRYGPKPTM